MADELKCWKCGTSLAAVPIPFARAAECPACRTDIHVCKQCLYYDTRAAKQCREPVADDVNNKERANFCGYFQPNPHAYQPRTAADTRAQLDALFGAPSSAPSNAAGKSPTDAAREELEKLFGGKS